MRPRNLQTQTPETREADTRGLASSVFAAEEGLPGCFPQSARGSRFNPEIARGGRLILEGASFGVGFGIPF